MPYLTKNTFNLKHGSLLCDLPIETTKYYLISTTMGLVKIRSCQTHTSKLLLARCDSTYFRPNSPGT